MNYDTTLLNRLLYTLLTVIAINPNTQADNIYLGGSYPFRPLTEANTLTVHKGELPVLPIPDNKGHHLSLSMLISSPDTRRAASGIRLALINEVSDTLSLTLKYQPGKDQIYDTDKLLLSISGKESCHTISLDCSASDFRVGGKDAAFTLITDPNPDQPSATLLCGRQQNHILWRSDETCREITTFLSPSSPAIKGIGFSSIDNDKITIKRLNLITTDTPEQSTPLTIADIKTAIADSQSPYAGFWTLLDYNLDDSYLRPGGDYLLAFLPASDNSYEIIYIEGASVNPGQWHIGDKKGHLTPTRMPGLYKATWYDAERETIDPNTTLQFSGTDLLTITLPRLNSVIRFHRTSEP